MGDALEFSCLQMYCTSSSESNYVLTAKKRTGISDDYLSILC